MMRATIGIWRTRAATGARAGRRVKTSGRGDPEGDHYQNLPSVGGGTAEVLSPLLTIKVILHLYVHVITLNTSIFFFFCSLYLPLILMVSVYIFF